MSAWIVSKKHIDLIVNAAANGTRDGALRPDAAYADAAGKDALGQTLVSECVASVSYRYPSDAPGELPGPCDGYYLRPYAYEDPGYLPTAAELYAAARCLRYQSCEHDGWKSSAASAFCEDLYRAIERAVPAAARLREAVERGDINASRLWPEHEAAPWGFDAEEIAACKARERAERCAALGVDPGIPDGLLHDLAEEGGPALATLARPAAAPPRESIGRDEAIKRIRAALKKRSGKTWSVTGGRGTAWGWIHIDAPPARRTWHDVVTADPAPPSPGAVYRGALGVTPHHRTELLAEDRITRPEDDPWAREAAERGEAVRYVWEVEDRSKKFGQMSPAERVELARLLGLDRAVHCQGQSIAASSDYYWEYIDRSEGKMPRVTGQQYWD